MEINCIDKATTNLFIIFMETGDIDGEKAVLLLYSEASNS